MYLEAIKLLLLFRKHALVALYLTATWDSLLSYLLLENVFNYIWFGLCGLPRMDSGRSQAWLSTGIRSQSVNSKEYQRDLGYVVFVLENLIGVVGLYRATYGLNNQ